MPNFRISFQVQRVIKIFLLGNKTEIHMCENFRDDKLSDNPKIYLHDI